MTGTPARWHGAAARSVRSASAMSTLRPESLIAYSISSSTHHALSETETAPIERMAAKAIDPLGEVAHRDADAVAGPHAVAVDQACPRASRRP